MQNHFSLKSVLMKAVALKDSQSFDGDLDLASAPEFQAAEAAVLIIVNDYNNSITLTKRHKKMRKHAGQIALAGGRRDPTDISLWDTAIREAHEEIGLPLDHPIEKIGQLPQHLTITKFAITPFVALNPAPFQYIAQETEVAEIFELPLSKLHPKKFKTESREYAGISRSFYVLPYLDYYIWGATACILYNLALRLQNVNSK